MLYNLQTTNKYILYTHILFKKHKYKQILHAKVNINNIHSICVVYCMSYSIVR